MTISMVLADAVWCTQELGPRAYHVLCCQGRIGQRSNAPEHAHQLRMVILHAVHIQTGSNNLFLWTHVENFACPWLGNLFAAAALMRPLPAKELTATLRIIGLA